MRAKILPFRRPAGWQRRATLHGRARHAEAAPVIVAGTCRCCALQFLATPRYRTAVIEVLEAHEAVCAGGARRGEVAVPFGR